MPTCRICSCTDEDHAFCDVIRRFQPAHGIDAEGLCSTCYYFRPSGPDFDRAYLRADLASRQSAWRWKRVPGGEALSRHAYQCLRVAVKIRRAERSMVKAPAVC